MMSRRTAFGVLAGGAAALLSGCGLFGGGNRYRFKMTVEVETPEGLKTGWSVYEVRAEKDIKLSPDMGNAHTSIRGEAVAVDLPGGKTLFALLQTVGGSGRDDLPYMSMKTLDPAYKNSSVESARRISSGDGIRSPADVTVGDYPMLVMFKDIADPKSVERVEPDNLAAAFGPGVKLKRITVQVTDEAVTSGIEGRLGWLAKVDEYDFGKDGPFYKNFPSEVQGLRRK